MIITCDITGCSELGSWSFKLCVPAEGHSPLSVAPLEAFIGVRLCRRHIEETNPGEWLDDDNGKMRKVFVLMGGGRYRPDFGKAYIKRISTMSPEYLRLEREGAGRPH
jgi:hypothetical protein